MVTISPASLWPPDHEMRAKDMSMALLDDAANVVNLASRSPALPTISLPLTTAKAADALAAAKQRGVEVKMILDGLLIIDDASIAALYTDIFQHHLAHSHSSPPTFHKKVKN